MSSAAERYEAARMRHAESKTVLAAFRRTKDFDLDPFQIDACKALESGHGVLVAAPTGAGKTVVGEFAVHLARHQQGKAFYTTPIKALSNQKFQELQAVYGEAEVGLLTGDVSINSEAPIVVMTTEVLRNMLYVGSATLSNLRHVVMDEVHYLADRSRGAVWEEVILHLPASVSITALSATVSNAEEFGDWLRQVRGDTSVIVEEHRPVPLWQYVAAGRDLVDLFVDEEQRRLNPELIRLARDEQHAARTRTGRPKRMQTSRHTPFRDRLVAKLDAQAMLPAIWFIFSRAGCDQAVAQLMTQHARLTSAAERAEISATVAAAVADLADDDLIALDFNNWSYALECGIAAHHAGLIPRFKEVVEGLFQRGLIKVVFATETLALGINMPARTVVIERLSKWNGDTHVDLTPGEYTQLTGRAGRRGIDDEGNSVVVWQPDVDPHSLAGLASTRTYPLKSSFRPGYTMAVNTVASLGYERAVKLLGESFAQFQADRGVTGLNGQLRKQDEALAGYREAMQCHLGDFLEYADLRYQINNAEKTAARAHKIQLRTDLDAELAQLQPGDVLMLRNARRESVAVVVATRPEPALRVTVLLASRELKRLTVHDLADGLDKLGKIKLPKGFDPRSAKSRSQAISLLREHPARRSSGRKADRAPSAVADTHTLRDALRNHPCHKCNDREEHARWGERYFKLLAERQGIAQQVAHRTDVLARDFGRVCAVLTELGYLTASGPDSQVTERGQALRRIHAESDLLVSEVVRRGLLDDLPAPMLVAALSLLVYEPRRDEPDQPRMPKGLDAVLQSISKVWGEVAEVETRNRLQPSGRPQPGFALPIYRWATGSPLSHVLRDADMSAGDFVRTTRRLIDLLEQLLPVSSTDLADRLGQALDLVRRGIIAEADWAEGPLD